ncbi:YqeG family HAD IIIA-type phosphatase [Spiroplasma turonicum]|uniref:Putative phosphatase HAD-superfamily/subfamily IIIa protein n=1 Tax=Spiroplasma turonicum TaxID=216946 RepID=A0A0K1P6C3_9MOLU|nr:HAD hydrolase-like protein [Spiroplasma turonicum]AKU79744.1 putative phosphatase HAD-superfamily/subfamily IIIa protein [Spiroplasma turonicum]ALX70762.1 putative phosphatase HAD-superfamily/subfamily IIIa protein [Spiroplasma turonicum]
MQNYKRKSLLLNYFKPSIYLESYKKVNLASLKNSGIKLLLCDMDNTLIGWNQRVPSNDVLNFIKNVHYHNMEFVLFSNNIRSRVENFAKKAGIDNYFWDCKKPLLGKMKLIKKLFDYKEEEMILIGDQLVTDVLVANRAHIKSILISPINRDVSSNKLVHYLENSLFKKLAQKNILHEGFYDEGDIGGNYEIL